MTGLLKELKAHLEKIRQDGPTGAYRDAAKLSLRHLKERNLSEIAIFLEMFCKDLRKWPEYLNAQRHSVRRRRIQALLGNSNRLLKKIFIEMHSDVIEELKKLQDRAQTQAAQDELQSVIVKFQEGEAEPARRWLQKAIMVQGRLARQARLRQQRTVHRVLAGNLRTLLKNLPH